MGKELRVRSDAAYDVAHRLAEATGESVDAVVEAALHAMDMRGAGAARGAGIDADRTADAIIGAARRDVETRRRAMTADGADAFSEAAVARRRERRRALVAENLRHLEDVPQVDDEFYDENGLPI